MKEMTIDEIKKVQLEILIYIDQICKENNIKYSLAYGTQIGAIRHKGFIPWDDDIDILLKRAEYNKLLDILYKNDNKKYKVFSLKDKGYFYTYAKVSDTNTIIKEKNWPDYKDLGVNIDIFPIDFVPEEKEKEYYDEAKHYEICLHNCLTNIAYVHDKSYIRLLKKLCRFREVKRCRKHDEWYWKNKLNQMTRLEDGKDMACIVTGGYRLWPKEMLDNYIDVEFEGHMFSSVRDYDKMLKSTYGDYMKIPPENERVSYHDFVAYWK